MKKSLIVVGAIVVVGLAIFLTYALGGMNTVSRNTATDDTAAPVPYQGNTTQPAPQATSTESATAMSPIDACAQSLKTTTEKSGIEYEKGSVLVSFEGGVTLDAAKKELTAQGLTYSVNDRGTSTPQVWGTVSVSSGQEFVEACTLEQNPDVHYAGINPILDLHD